MPLVRDHLQAARRVSDSVRRRTFAYWPKHFLPAAMADTQGMAKPAACYRKGEYVVLTPEEIA